MKSVHTWSWVLLGVFCFSGCGPAALTKTPIKKKAAVEKFEVEAAWEGSTVWISSRKGRYKMKYGDWEGFGWLNKSKGTLWVNHKEKTYFDDSNPPWHLPKLESDLKELLLRKAEFEEAFSSSPCEVSQRIFGSHTYCENWTRDGIETWEHWKVETGAMNQGFKRTTKILKHRYDPKHGLIMLTEFSQHREIPQSSDREEDRYFERSKKDWVQDREFGESFFEIPTDYQDLVEAPALTPTPRPTPPQMEGIGLVTRVSGHDLMTRAEGESEWSPGRSGQVVQVNDAFETAKYGGTKISLAEGNVLHIRGESQVSLLAADDIALVKGAVLIEAGKENVRLKFGSNSVDVLNAVVGVSQGETFLLSVEKGSASISFNNEFRELNKGQSAALSRPPSEELKTLLLSEDFQSSLRAYGKKSLGSKLVPVPVERRLPKGLLKSIRVKRAPLVFRWKRRARAKQFKRYLVVLTSTEKEREIVWFGTIGRGAKEMLYPLDAPILNGKYHLFVLGLKREKDGSIQEKILGAKFKVSIKQKEASSS